MIPDVAIPFANSSAGKNPKDALHFFDRLGLYTTIFTDPTVQGTPNPSTTNWDTVYNCLDILRMRETPGSIYQSLVRSDDAKYLAWVLAALAPWSAVPQPATTNPKKSLPLGALAAREGIKMDNKMTSVITGAFRHREEVTSLKDAIKGENAYVNDPGTVGMSIRRWEALGGQWRLQALFALLVEVLNNPEGEQPHIWEIDLLTVC
jgi:tRNA nucleotidyltransferase (CCA-adding enzyme)